MSQKMKKTLAGLVALSSVAHSAISADLEDELLSRQTHRQRVESFLEELETKDAPKSTLLNHYIKGENQGEDMADWEAYAKWTNKF